MRAIIITVSDIQPVTDMISYDTHRDDLKIDKVLVASKMNDMIAELIKIMNSNKSIVTIDDLKEYLSDKISKLEDEYTLVFEDPGLFLLTQILLESENHPEIRDTRDRLVTVEIIDPSGDVIIHYK